MKKYSFVLSFFFAGLLVLLPTQAQQQDHLKNYNNCLHGYSGCDPSRLTDDEKTQIQKAAHQRNYNNCLHGYSGCDASRLTDAERAPVQEASHQRNYNSCLHGYSGCDVSVLTDAEKSAISAGRSNNPIVKPQLPPNAGQNAPPHYYTNRDGQRVQSPTYSNTIPAGATAQCRDGSYSFSQHHQGTCSHHGGVAKWLDQ
jgi:hypothetical protein